MGGCKVPPPSSYLTARSDPGYFEEPLETLPLVSMLQSTDQEKEGDRKWKAGWLPAPSPGIREWSSRQEAICLDISFLLTRAEKSTCASGPTTVWLCLDFPLSYELRLEQSSNHRPFRG